MLDRELGQVSVEMTTLAVKAGMSRSELESACRMWQEQHGKEWHEVGLKVLRERSRNVDLRMLAKLEQAGDR